LRALEQCAAPQALVDRYVAATKRFKLEVDAIRTDMYKKPLPPLK